ncbi:hypothetical protein ACHAWF_015350 [Thalassiosira exigua]
MGHGKNKSQKSQKVGLGQEPKETREQRRRRIAEEAKAKEDCLEILPYALWAVLFSMVLFGLYVRSLPPKIVLSEANFDPNVMGETFEEVPLAEEGEVVNLDGDDL